MEVLGVVLLRHVLVYGQPRRADAQFTRPGVAQLLQGRRGRKKKKKTIGRNPTHDRAHVHFTAAMSITGTVGFHLT